LNQPALLLPWLLWMQLTGSSSNQYCFVSTKQIVYSWMPSFVGASSFLWKLNKSQSIYHWRGKKWHTMF